MKRPRYVLATGIYWFTAPALVVPIVVALVSGEDPAGSSRFELSIWAGMAAVLVGYIALLSWRSGKRAHERANGDSEDLSRGRIARLLLRAGYWIFATLVYLYVASLSFLMIFMLYTHCGPVGDHALCSSRVGPVEWSALTTGVAGYAVLIWRLARDAHGLNFGFSRRKDRT